ncbi:MAG: hypothetical protein IPH20_01820 [Bacteroidales bacterium]|nr:hypothetical protein [Bacteroidales bacterium]
MLSQIGKLTDPESVTGLLSSSSLNIQRLVSGYHHTNPWFTDIYIKKSLKNISAGLRSGINPELISRLYPKNRTVAFIINPGAPLDGIGEVIFTALNGFNCLVKLPADSKSLFEALFGYLFEDFPEINEKVRFLNERLPDFDGVIGLNAFERSGAISYLEKWPNLLIYHKGCTVTLAGNENSDQLGKVAGGICNFYGRSFFSVKSLQVPEGYDFSGLFLALQQYQDNAINHRYFNHYEYHKALMLINSTPHLDNGFVLLTSDLGQTGKTGVVSYTIYHPYGKNRAPAQTGNELPLPMSGAEYQHIINGQLQPEATLLYNSRKLADFLSDL